MLLLLVAPWLSLKWSKSRRNNKYRDNNNRNKGKHYGCREFISIFLFNLLHKYFLFEYPLRKVIGKKENSRNSIRCKKINLKTKRKKETITVSEIKMIGQQDYDVVPLSKIFLFLRKTFAIGVDFYITL